MAIKEAINEAVWEGVKNKYWCVMPLAGGVCEDGVRCEEVAHTHRRHVKCQDAP